MAQYTPHLNLYKPGGGSTGTNTPDEVVDIDRINQNMDLIDAFAADAFMTPTITVVTAPLPAGWVRASGQPGVTGITFWKDPVSGFVYVEPGEWSRTTALTVSAGGTIGLVNLPVGFRPPSTVAAGVGTIGVGGNLGASRFFVQAGGDIIFQSLVTSGTMAVGGGTSNNLTNGLLMFRPT